MTRLQAITLLNDLTSEEIREQLELSGCFIEFDLEECDNQQLYALALQELTDC